MAHAKKLPDSTTKALAQRVGSFMRFTFPSSSLKELANNPQEGPSLAESLEIWDLSTEDIEQGEGKRLVDLARATGRWHHQLRSGELVTGYARSLGTTAEALKVLGFFRSPLAEKIDSAIKWIDDQTHNDPVVHLLKELKGQTHMLWLLDEETGKSQCIALEGELRRQEPYDEEGLLTRLRELPAAVGLKK